VQIDYIRIDPPDCAAQPTHTREGERGSIASTKYRREARDVDAMNLLLSGCPREARAHDMNFVTAGRQA
jgi:hypothetical protein